MYALGKISDENAAAAVLATLQDERYGREVRNTAEKALIEIGTPAVPLLISALVRTPNERTWITPLLARFGPTAIDPLLKALRDSFFPAQSAAIIDALGEIGDARSVGPLMDIIRGHSGNSDAARTALDKVWKKQREGNKDQPPHGV